MTGLTYMQRRKGSGIYEFRKRLPNELAGKSVPLHMRPDFSELINPQTGSFKRELTVSLRTTDHQAAKRRDLREALRVTDLIEAALASFKAGPSASASGQRLMPAPEEIEAEILTELLAEDEREREEGDSRRHHQTAEERAQWPDLTDALMGQRGMAEGHLEVMAEEIEMLLADYRGALARRRTDIIRPELHVYLKARGIPIDPSSPEYREASLAVLRAHVRAYELMQGRHSGEVIPTPAPVLTEAKGPKLSEAFALWKEGSAARGAKRPSRNTVAEAERAVRYFTQWHGDLRLGEIDKPKARDFRNALARLPTRLTAKQRAMPLRALLGVIGEDREAAHASTVNKALNLLAAIVGATEREGLTDDVAGFANPFRNLRLTLDKREGNSQRTPFSEADLGALFADRVFRAAHRPAGGGGEAAYWFPLLALLTGARLNEIAQLRPADLRQDPETGIWFIDIGTDGGRSIKSATSRRNVPLHGELLRLGLLRYREAVLARKGAKQTDSLWPDVRSADEVYRSTAWSKWFNRYLRRNIGLADRSLVFHSFRHSFKRLCRDAGLTEELHDALTGHAGGGSVGRGYGAGFGLKALEAGIARIEAPRPVRVLAPWQGL